ncbi:MAG: cyclase [Ruminococcaceae bacterium]|nr:cyclase [Oscillospiraceae bacterium]
MIYDITQELFSGGVWPGDFAPEYERTRSFDKGDTSTVSIFKMSAHNATHIDAPIHRIKGGKGIDEIALDACVGECEVISINDKQRLIDTDAKRILIRDCKTIDVEVARLLVDKGVVFVGAEGLGIGDRPTHNVLLSAEVVILEGAVLSHVPEGKYFLSALPIKLGGFDGAPCRAILISQ